MFDPQVRRPSRRSTKTAERFAPMIPGRGIGTEYVAGQRWAVYLDGAKTGHIYEIQPSPNAAPVYRYETLRGHKGETFPDFAACRASLD